MGSWAAGSWELGEGPPPAATFHLFQRVSQWQMAGGERKMPQCRGGGARIGQRVPRQEEPGGCRVET